MAYNQDRLQKRNDAIRKRYSDLKNKYPKWRWEVYVEQVADEYFLAPSTISKIVTGAGEKMPCADTVIKYTKGLAPALKGAESLI